MRALTIALLTCLWTLPARADEPPQATAIVAGVATAIVPFGASAMWLSREGGLQEPRAAVIALAAGLALAPIVGHAVLGEWDRAALFGALPVAAATGLVAVFEVRPDTFRRANRVARVSAGLLLTALLATSSVGLLDCFFATGRAPVTISATPLRGGATLSIGGWL